MTLKGLDFGRLVATRRRDMGLSLRDLATRTGLSASTISRVENGLYSPTYDNAARLAAALEIATWPLAAPPTPVTADAQPATSLTERARPLITSVPLKRVSVPAGQRRQISKIAARDSYSTIVVLEGTMLLHLPGGRRERVDQGQRIDASQFLAEVIFGLAMSDVELLFMGEPA